MQVLVINQDQVPQLLPMGECIQVMEEAFKAMGRGQAIQPLRKPMVLPGQGFFSTMPAYLGDIQSVGAKVLTVFASNEGTEYDSHLGVVLLFETQHGLLQAIIDATSITAIRTGAVSGLATRLLARPDAGDLAILGSGTQARQHLEAMSLVRPIRHVRVWSRNSDHARQFAEQASRQHRIAVEVQETAQQAVNGADIICTTTSAPEPVLLGEWISPGAHINAAGAFGPKTRELDTRAVVKSRLFVDRRESTLNEAGEFLIPRQEGVIDESHIAGELGELLLGQVSGRTSPEQITLFKSLGLGIQDIASARHIYNRAKERGLGAAIEIGGRH
jgi:alanine dehydrogenase